MGFSPIQNIVSIASLLHPTVRQPQSNNNHFHPTATPSPHTISFPLASHSKNPIVATPLSRQRKRHHLTPLYNPPSSSNCSKKYSLASFRHKGQSDTNAYLTTLDYRYYRPLPRCDWPRLVLLAPVARSAILLHRLYPIWFLYPTGGSAATSA